MSENKINVNGEEYILASSVKIEPSIKQIVVLQRGWVVVGDFSQEGCQCILNNASVIRVWGTDKGLGQLSIDGPLNGTILDHCEPCRFHELNIILRMNVKNPEKW